MAVTGPGYIIHCFNSTLVQLKEGADTNGDVYNNRFNSTLVQLKVPPKCLLALLSPRFNSTLVQLKEHKELNADSPEYCFNSTLVQLKVKI